MRPFSQFKPRCPDVLWGAIASMALFLVGMPAATAQQLTTVRIGSAVKSIFSLPLYVAEQKGFFTDEGVKADISFFGGGPPATAALLGGSVDLISSAFENQLKVVKRGQKVVSLITVQSTFSGALLIRKDIADKLGRAPTIRDVKGLNIGTLARGGFADNAARYLLAASGINPEKDANLIPLRGFDKHIAAGKAKEIDASLMVEPWPTIAADSLNEWTYIVNFSLGEGPDLFQDMSYVTLQTTPDFIKKNRPTAEKVVRALVRAQAFIADKKNLDELAAIARHVFTDTEESVLRTSIEHQLKTFTPALMQSAIDKNISLLKSSGQFDGDAPTYESVVDLSFKTFWHARPAP
jgi:NitT/TauT family transport system substrate-binding protein